MGSSQDATDKSFKRSRRSYRIAFLFAILFAALWSVHIFFAAVLLGTCVYFTVLGWYYRYQARPKEPDLHVNPPKPKWDFSRKSPVSASKRTGQSLLLPITTVIAILALGITIAFYLEKNPPEIPVGKEESSRSIAQVPVREISSDIDTLTNIGNAYFNGGQYDSALIFYDKVLQIEPANQYALYNKALVYYAQKEYTHCKRTVANCLRQDPNYGDALWLMGDIYFDRGEKDSARFFCDRAYNAGVRHGDFLQLLASLYEMEDVSKAIRLYQESLQQDSSLTDSYRMLAELIPKDSAHYLQLMKKFISEPPKQ
jgi:cytochrome c-type biogenesis protein CcmH/NrfG